MELDLKSRTAVVSGASMGIGRAIAKGLALEGVRVVAVARRKELLDKLAQEVKAEGGEVIPLIQDITAEDAAKKLAATGRVDSIICIGCVLRGETSHYDYVCSETARGIQLAQLDSGVPMAFCVLTCDTLEQAIDRAGLKGGNKGYESGLGAIEMANLSRKLAKKSAARKTTTASTKRARRRR